jgi:hypothetical protein
VQADRRVDRAQDQCPLRAFARVLFRCNKLWSAIGTIENLTEVIRGVSKYAVFSDASFLFIFGRHQLVSSLGLRVSLVLDL